MRTSLWGCRQMFLSCIKTFQLLYVGLHCIVVGDPSVAWNMKCGIYLLPGFEHSLTFWKCYLRAFQFTNAEVCDLRLTQCVMRKMCHNWNLSCFDALPSTRIFFHKCDAFDIVFFRRLTDRAFQPYLDQIDQLEASVTQLEQAAYRLDGYSKKLGKDPQFPFRLMKDNFPFPPRTMHCDPSKLLVFTELQVSCFFTFFYFLTIVSSIEQLKSCPLHEGGPVVLNRFRAQYDLKALPPLKVVGLTQCRRATNLTKKLSYIIRLKITAEISNPKSHLWNFIHLLRFCACWVGFGLTPLAYWFNFCLDLNTAHRRTRCESQKLKKEERKLVATMVESYECQKKNWLPHFIEKLRSNDLGND